MDIQEAIKTHGADAVFAASAAGACENYEPLKTMGLDVDTIADAEQISLTVYRQLQ